MAFWNCDNLTIYGEAGSCAETYVNEHEIYASENNNNVSFKSI